MSDTELIVIPLDPIPAYLVGEIKSKLAYVDESIACADILPGGLQISLFLKNPLDENKLAGIIEKVQRVVHLMTDRPARFKVQVLEDYLERQVPFQADPFPLLVEAGEVSQEAGGLFALGPLLSRLIDYFERKFVQFAKDFGATPYRFPTLIPARYLARVNYFRAFPQSLSFATHLRADLNAVNNFAEHAACNHDNDLIAPTDSFAPIQALLSPAVCYHLYFSLADRPLPGGKLVATAVGSCFRYESLNLNSLERLWNFTMRELIFVGSKDFVLENRESARQYMYQVFKEIGLAYQVESANDPFFIGEFRKQTAFQSAFQLKYEIRASLPFKNSTLAVGSYNYHQDFFGRHLNITLPDGSPAHTGCVAFGLERMAFAFLSQFGLNIASWPDSVREGLT